MGYYEEKGACIARQRITAVDPGSPAEKAGISVGDVLISINGEPVLDIIDYEQLTCNSRLDIAFSTGAGDERRVKLKKEDYEPLGLSFESSLMSKVKSCHNHCLFCFIDQMPHGVRDTLHFKDDDWRLSLIMGNYVTLTNVSDEEFERILRRRVSPLYISVHATDGDVRSRMMRNPTASRIMERLTALRDAGLEFDAQIVLCPGYNDGEVLRRTLEELYSLTPAARSVAVVPVGLTKFRERLEELRALSVTEAKETLCMIEAFDKRARADGREGFAYASDEMYIIANEPLPTYESYGEFLQIENGVGLLRKFEREFTEALSDMTPLESPVRVTAVTGESAYAFLRPLFETLRPYNIEVDLRRIRNDYFGGIVSVAGLITATDILAQLGACERMVIIPDDMLREREDVFLDGHDLRFLEEGLRAKLLPLAAADGEEFIYGLIDGLKAEE